MWARLRRRPAAFPQFRDPAAPPMGGIRVANLERMVPPLTPPGTGRGAPFFGSGAVQERPNMVRRYMGWPVTLQKATPPSLALPFCGRMAPSTPVRECSHAPVWLRSDAQGRRKEGGGVRSSGLGGLTSVRAPLGWRRSRITPSSRAPQPSMPSRPFSGNAFRASAPGHDFAFPARRRSSKP